jgi:peptidoglycan hydrolase CwlO-like protein
MRKNIFILFFVAAICCSRSINAQEATWKSQRDSIQQLFNEALVILDSVIGINIELSKELDQLKTEVKDWKTEISNILKEKNETVSVLASAKKIILEQTAKIEKLEAEVKRLSQSKKSL